VIVVVITGIVAGLAGGLGVAWLQNSGARAHYLTAQVERGNIAVVIPATGELRASGGVSVPAPVAGRIRELLVADNATVKAGQVLATVDADVVQARLRTRSNSGARLRALARQLKASVPALAARADALDQLLRTTRDTLADVKGSSHADATTIVSPIDGVVVSHAVHAGQRISPADDFLPLFVIARNSDMELHATLDETDVSKVHDGQEARITTGAYGKRQFAGKVTTIVHTPRPIQGGIGYEAVIIVPNPDHALWPGMTASIRLMVEPRREVVRIPNGVLRVRLDDAAFRAGLSRPVIYRISDGEPRPVDVELGVSDDTFTEVVSGLSAGDVIVTGVADEERSPASHADGRSI
jgi:HlyD family secretion protein